MMVVVAAAFTLSAACGPPGPTRTVQRVNPNAQVDLSGAWNDTDANMVARAMIQDCLSRPWAAKFKAANGRDPVVRLSPIRNRTDEHINTKFFTKQVEMELLNSGMVKVVASREEAWDQRAERADQARHASDETVKSQGQEIGSDFLLNGWVVMQHDAVSGQSVRAFITTMELINSKDNTKVWMKVHKIKKVVTQTSAEW
jgi:PBP1b-binding outer membrane lipoprotein LpoB